MIYEKDQADYLNWFPMVLSLKVEDEMYTFEDLPTISLEGMKYLFRIVDDMRSERSLKGVLSIIEEYDIFNWGATEGEFYFILKNAHEENKISIELWFNATCLSANSVSYSRGFNFQVFSEEFIEFIAHLKNQLYELTEGHEGERLI